MSNEKAIKRVKRMRVMLSNLIKEIRTDEELSYSMKEEGHHPKYHVLDKLQESRMWMGMMLQGLSDETPYIHADNPDNAIVTPEADVEQELSFDSFDQYTITGRGTVYIATYKYRKVVSLAGKIILLDDKKFRVKGVETKGILVQGDTIGLLGVFVDEKDNEESQI